MRAVTLLGLEELVTEFGGNFQELIAEAGFGPVDGLNADEVICARRALELGNLAAERLGRLDLGLIWGERSDPSRLGPLHVALMNANTGRQSVEMIVRFLHLHFPTGEVFLKALPDVHHEIIGLRSHMRAPPPLIQFYERRIGSIHVILKLVCGPDYLPEQVWFTHQKTAPANAYSRVFGIRPLFNMPENGIVLTQRILDKLRPTANAQVHDMAVSYLKSRAAPGRRASISEETRYMIATLMRSTNTTLTMTARALGVHPRTLQRRLLEEGASFEQIKDLVRQQMAIALLEDEKVAMLDVAFALHYANMSAFTRSCRRWFGKPPTLLRSDFAKSRSPFPARDHERSVPP